MSDLHLKGIRKGVLGKRDALGQSIAMNGPAATLSIYLVAIIGTAGYLTSVVLGASFIVYSLMTYMVYQWSSETDSPAPWMVYVEKGLGRAAGFVAGWVYWLYYVIGFAGFSLLGLSSFIYYFQEFQNLKWIWVFVVLMMSFEAIFVSLKKVEISTRYFFYAGMAEIIFLTCTSLYLIIRFHGNLPMLLDFRTGGISFISIILGIGAFGGISGLTPLAGETKDYKKEIPSALVQSLLIIGSVIIIGSIGQTLAMGSSSIANYASAPDPGLVIYMRYLGLPFFLFLMLLVLNSFNSSLLATSNNFTRMMYGISEKTGNLNMVRERINSNGIPYVSLLVGVLIGTTVALVAGTILTPLVGSIFLLVMAAIFSYTIHIMVSLSLMIRKIRSSSVSIIKHVVVPIFVTLILVVAIYSSIFMNAIFPYNYSVAISVVYILSITFIYFITQKERC